MRRSRQRLLSNSQLPVPHRTIRPTLFTTFLIFLLFVLYSQPSSAAPVSIPLPLPISLPEQSQQSVSAHVSPFDPEHNYISGDLQPIGNSNPNSNSNSNNAYLNPIGTATAGGNALAGPGTEINSNNSEDGDGISSTSPTATATTGLKWTQLSSIFVDVICATDGRAILLGFLIGSTGTWLVHVLVQRFFLRRGWVVALWPSRRRRRRGSPRRRVAWDMDRDRNRNGNGANDGSAGGEVRQERGSNNRQVTTMESA